jgi:replicative DNA helicase
MLAPIPSNDSDIPLRNPPHNYEAEQALLGALLMNNRSLEQVAEFLKPEHFTNPLHVKIYDACLTLSSKNQLASPVTLKSYLQGDPDLIDMGGDSYLARLAGSAASLINVLDYGQLIFDLHLRRELIDLGENVVNLAFDADVDNPAINQIEIAEQKLFDIASTGIAEKGFKDFKIAMKEAIEQAANAFKNEGRLSGVTTGLRDLNAKLGGMHRSDLIILAGRPSMGKTALATNIAFSAAKACKYEIDSKGDKILVDGAVVAFFSLEMSAAQLANRIIAEQTEIDSNKIREGQINPEEFERLAGVSQDLENLPLYIDDTPALSVSAVRTRARRLSRTRNLGLIVVDYLQLLMGTSGKRSENRVQEISDITRSLKALAKELNVPVLALSQLSRAVEQREDKRPQLADLRESGSIEQDADVVMFVFREQYYLEKSEPMRRDNESEEKLAVRHQEWRDRCEEMHNIAEVIIAKQRHGPIGTIRLQFEGRFTKFQDLDTIHHEGR